MTKKLLSILIAIIMVLSLAGCGSSSAQTENAAPASTVAPSEKPAEKPAEEEVPDVRNTEPDTAPETSDIKDALTGVTLEKHNGIPVIHNNSVIVKENEYKLEGLYSELLTDRAIDRCRKYFHLDSADDGVPELIWHPSEGAFTTLQIFLKVTNLSDTPCRFGDTVKLRVVFDEGGNEKNLEGPMLQSNPGQVDERGYDTIWSLVFIDVKKDEQVILGSFFDVDRATHDALVSEDTDQPVWAYMDFSNGDKYCINLNSDMVLFGYDDSEPDSMITGDVHRMMKAATGSEYMEQFLDSNEFAQIAKMADIDMKEAAQCFSAPFQVKVTDIEYSDENTATAYCDVISPDFVQMYKNLDELGPASLGGIKTEDEFYKAYGRLLLDYVSGPDCPTMTRSIEIPYKYDAPFKQWAPLSRDSAMGEMRVALLNF